MGHVHLLMSGRETGWELRDGAHIQGVGFFNLTLLAGTYDEGAGVDDESMPPVNGPRHLQLRFEAAER